MKGILEIYRYTFKYKWTAILVIVFNLLYVISNLIAMALFIPFLQIIFLQDKPTEALVEPVYNGGFVNFFSYCGKYYDFTMQSMAESDPKTALLFVCISVSAAFLLKNIFRYGAIWFQSQLRMSVVRDIRDALFSKSMRLPLSYFTDERKGDLISRMQSDVGEIENAVIAMLELFFREPIAIILYLSALFYWSVSLTTFSIILLPITALIIMVIGKSLKRTAKQGQEQMGFLYSLMDEGLGGIRIIKAFNAIKPITNRFKHENLKHQKLITKAFRKRDLSSPLNETLGAFVLMVIVWFGGSLILDAANSGLTAAQFITFIVIFTQLLVLSLIHI